MKRKIILLSINLIGCVLLVLGLIYIGKGGKFYWWLLAGVGLIMILVADTIPVKKEIKSTELPSYYSEIYFKGWDPIRCRSSRDNHITFTKEKDSSIDTLIKSINLDD